MSLKFVTVNDNVFQLLGMKSARPPTGAPPFDPAGGLPSLRPSRLCSSKISLKNPPHHHHHHYSSYPAVSTWLYAGYAHFFVRIYTRCLVNDAWTSECLLRIAAYFRPKCRHAVKLPHGARDRSIILANGTRAAVLLFIMVTVGAAAIMCLIDAAEAALITWPFCDNNNGNNNRPNNNNNYVIINIAEAAEIND